MLEVAIVIEGRDGIGCDRRKRLGRTVEVRRVMLQWLEAGDIDGLEAMSENVLPHL